MSITLTIYSLGSSTILGQALDAVGEVTGAGDFPTMLYVASVIGVLFIVFQAFRGGMTGVDFRHLIVTFLVYGVFDATTVTVNVEQVYGAGTGAVYQASGVPIGLAVMGNVISLMGYELNLLVSQAFETANAGASQVSSTSFMADLNTLNGIKINTIGVSGLGSANAAGGGDFYDSWFNYFSDCTLPGISSGAISSATIMNTTDFLTNVELNVTTSQFLLNTTGLWSSVTCSAGYTTLANYTQQTFLPVFYSVMLPAVPAAQGVSTAVPGLVTTALMDLGLSGATADGQTFVQNSVLEPIFTAAAQQDADLSDRFAFATEVADAMGNQNSLLLAGQSMFYNYVGPALSVLECLVYALFPMVLLMMMFGMNPVAVLGSYGKFVLWTQLWLPTLAVIQFFELMTISTNTANAEGWGQAYLSYAGSANLNNLITDQLAIIGMLASAVPVICWGIVAGGSAAVNAVGSGLSSTGTVKSEVGSPREIGQQFSGSSYSSLRTGDPTSGVRPTGVEATLPTFQWSASSGEAVSSAASAKMSAMDEFRQLVSHSLNTSSGVDRRAAQGASVRDSLSTTSGEGWSEARDRMGSVAHSIAQTTGMSSDAVTQMAVQMAAGASAQATIGTPGRGMLGSGASVTGSISGSVTGLASQTQSGSVGQRTEAARLISDAFKQDSSLRDDLTATAAKDISSSRDTSAFMSNSTSDGDSLQKSAARVLSADRSYSDALSSSSQQGTSESIGALAAVQKVEKSPEAQEALSRATSEFGIGNEVQAFVAAHGDSAADFGGRSGLETFAQMAVLSGLAGGVAAGSSEGVRRQNAFNQVMSKAEPFSPPAAAESREDSALATGSVAGSQGGGLGGGGGGQLGSADNITPTARGSGHPSGGVEGVFESADRGIDGSDVASRYRADVARDDKRGAATLGAPVERQEAALEMSAGERQRNLSLGERVSGAAAHAVHAVLGAEAAPLLASAKAHGLTDSQAELYALYGSGSGGRHFGAIADQERAAEKRVEAEAGPRGSEIVDRIKAAAYDPGSVNSERRLDDIASFNIERANSSALAASSGSD